QLCDGVFDVELHGVEADTQARGDDAIRHAVTHGVHHSPLRGRQDVRMPGPAATRHAVHDAILATTAPNYPPLTCAHYAPERRFGYGIRGTALPYPHEGSWPF